MMRLVMWLKEGVICRTGAWIRWQPVLESKRFWRIWRLQEKKIWFVVRNVFNLHRGDVLLASVRVVWIFRISPQLLLSFSLREGFWWNHECRMCHRLNFQTTEIYMNFLKLSIILYKGKIDTIISLNLQSKSRKIGDKCGFLIINL